MKKDYRCAIIGQHPMRFPWGFDEEDAQCRRMKLELVRCIMELRQCGVMEFQVVCDPGDCTPERSSISQNRMTRPCALSA